MMLRRLILFALLLAATVLTQAATHYVKPTGNDALDGHSLVNAWQHIQRACTTLVAGDTVLIRAGTYNEASPYNGSVPGTNAGLKPKNSGSSGLYIVFKGFPGDALPTILGVNDLTGTNGRYVADITNRSYLVYDSLHLHYGWMGFNALNTRYVTIRNCVIDSLMSGNYDNNGAFTCYLASSTDHTSTDVEYITIEGCDISQVGKDGSYKIWNASGIHLYHCSNMIFRNNKIHDVEDGITLKGGEVALPHSGPIEISGNTFYNNNGGVWVGNGGQFFGTTVSNNVFYNNSVYAIGMSIPSNADTCYASYNTLIYNNTIDCGGTGSGLRAQMGDIDSCSVFNNIIYNPTLNAGDYGAGIGFKNYNIGNVCCYSPSRFYEDYNLFSGRSDHNYYIWPLGTTYTLTTWKAASPTGVIAGQAAHTTEEDPLFTNATNHIYTLQAGSPAATGGRGGIYPTYRGAFAPTTYWTLEGGYRNACHDTIEISAGTYNIPYSDTCYCLSSPKIVSATWGINANNRHGWSLLNKVAGIKDTLIFGDGVGTWNDPTGIGMGATAETMYVKNIVVMGDSSKDSTGSAIGGNPGRKVWLDSCDIIGKGTLNWPIYFGGGNVYGIKITDCTVAFYADRFRTRCSHEGSAIRIEIGADTSATAGVIIRNTKILTCPHTPIAIEGNTKGSRVEIVGCSLKVDTRNVMYTTNGGACFSSGDAFGIDILGMGHGSRIDSNFIYYDSLYQGGQGIMLQGVKGRSYDSAFVRSNHIKTSCGPNTYNTSGFSSGIYVRMVPGGSDSTGNEYLTIRDNQVDCFVDTDTNTTYRGRSAAGLCGYFSPDESNWSSPMIGIVMERNRVIMHGTGTLSGYYKCIAFDWGSADSNQAGYAISRDRISRHNYYESPVTPIGIGNRNGLQGNGLLSIGDTINCTRNSDSAGVVFGYNGAYREHSIRNRFRDTKWQGYASDLKLVFSAKSGDNDTLGEAVGYERTVQILVTDSVNAPKADVVVTSTNAYAQVFADTSGIDGITEVVCTYKRKAVRGTSWSVFDSLGYNDYSIKAKLGNDSTLATLTLSPTLCCDTLMLGQTTGGIFLHRRRIISESE